MRILLAHNSTYYPAHGGGDKSNRLLVEALAAKGHEVRVVSRTANSTERDHIRLLHDLAERNVAVQSSGGGVVIFQLSGVTVHTATTNQHLRAYFAAELETFRPDVVLASTDDPAQVLLETALQDGRARIVYLVRATLALPFGPDCAFPSETHTQKLRRCDAIVGVSEYVADYVRKHGGMPHATHVPISLMDPGPWPLLGRYSNEFITMANPCAVKGISIFLALADRLPDLRFAAVPTWGTLDSDLEALRERPNVTILPPVDRIDDLLEKTRALLVPSLWAEARSRIIVEAMLRGIPVLASDVGGIPEAKMGVEYLLPVKPIERYRSSVDEQMVPVPEVPVQRIGPWEDALRDLLGNPRRWEQVSHESRDAAVQYASHLNVDPFESLLLQTLAAPHRTAPASATSTSIVDRLSPEKKALLALRLKRREQQGSVFTNMDRDGRLRLFCFPHAGGSVMAFHGWEASLPSGVVVSALRLRPLEARDAMREAVIAASRKGEQFAFFGHSMGSIVAFEMARAMRKYGARLPKLLVASGARAPQYRRGWVPPPDPTREEMLESVMKLDGIPPDILNNPRALEMVFPAVESDLRGFRKYTYQEEPPLDCPIAAYVGQDDPNVKDEHIDAWHEQTTASFVSRRFPGGHFYLQTGRPEFLRVLASDLETVI